MRGGAETFFAQLCPGLADRGFAITILTAVQSPTPVEGVQTVRDIRPGSSAPGMWFWQPFASTLGYIRRHRRRISGLMFTTVCPELLAGYVSRKLWKIPYVARVATLPGPDGDFDRLVNRSRLGRLVRPALRAADRIVVLNRSAPGALACCAVSPARILYIPNGVDLGRFPFRRCSPSQGVRVGFLGRLAWQKGADVLFKAIRQDHGQFRWLIVGDGEMRAEAERLARECPRVEYIPSLTPEQVVEFHRRIDLFVMPSRAEGMSNAVLEALASGTPTILGDNPANREFASAAEFAVLGDAQSLLDRISRLAADPLRMTTLADSGRRLVERNFSLDRAIAAYAELWRGILQPGRDTA
jgi:glycosyltransferase involved in cell wall biosynthesis